MATIAERAKAVKDKAAGRVERAKSLAPSYGRLKPSLFAGERRTPHVTTGPVGQDSAGYSFRKAHAFINGVIQAEDCKEEVEVSNRLRHFYKSFGKVGVHDKPSITVLASADPMYHPECLRDDSEGKRLLGEWRQKLFASTANADPDEVTWHRQKALGTYPATSGGSFVPPPSLLGDYIDLQRNMEFFSNAGASNMTFTPQGRMLIPRLTGASTAYWVGEGATITESQATTGDLQLDAKKLAVRTRVTVEGLNFSNPSLEAMARTDMAAAAALKADLASLEGTGGTQIKGLTTYTGDSNSYLNIQTVVASTVGTNGDTIQPEDVQRMLAKLPDVVRRTEVAWGMHPEMFAPIMNRRADAVSANDGKGPFVFNTWRANTEKTQDQLDGRPVYVTRQFSQNRVKGSGSNLNYILLGRWSDWVIARFGVIDVLMNPFSDTDFTNATTSLRTIQFIDAGPRTPNSFIIMDNLLAS